MHYRAYIILTRTHLDSRPGEYWLHLILTDQGIEDPANSDRLILLQTIAADHDWSVKPQALWQDRYWNYNLAPSHRCRGTRSHTEIEIHRQYNREE